MFLRYIFGIKKNLTINNFFDHDMYISNDGWSFNMILEILFDDIYKYLWWCDHFLDIGGFLWESAIYFSTVNQKVTVYEADPDNFKYLTKNVSNIHNIVWHHNMAVMWDDTVEIKFYKDNENDPWSSMMKSSGKKSFVVQCINFFDIIQKYPDIDGIKLDIEGGEYTIVKQFTSENFHFKKWQIEFHDLDADKFSVLSIFIGLLQSQWYIFEFIDIYGKIISYEEIKNLSNRIFTMYFVKI